MGNDKEMIPNPFTVFSPEGVAAADVVETFVSDVPGVDAIQGDGHTLLIGSRGCGKTMILRFLEPDCQCAKKKLPLEELPFYGAYLTIKQTDLSYPEFNRISGTHIDNAINEHVLVLTIIMKILSRAIQREIFISSKETLGDQGARSINSIFSRIYFDNREIVFPGQSLHEACSAIVSVLNSEFDKVFDFFDGLMPANFSETTSFPRFSGKIFRFNNFLLPLIDAYRNLPGMPISRRFFLMIDDADNLNRTQTSILNTWISQRLPECSLKVAAQIFEYKTFYTLNERMIETPHDYNEINISDYYTSNRGNFYKDRIRNIVNRRLQKFGIPPAPGKALPEADRFFPEDHQQLIDIDRIARKYKQNWTTSGRGARGRDDAYRYSRPDYITSLGGTKKSRHRYSYSGFEQLVHVSSGVPRYFLEAAHKMFDRELAIKQGDKFYQIEPENQDQVLRDQAAVLFQKELGKLQLSDLKQKGSTRTAVYLHNLVTSLCNLFQKILLTEGRSERRVFSFAIQDRADDEVAAVLRMGVQNSYFALSSIGRKEGFGRTERYVLTRRLAPAFNLDPNGFSGYQFLTNRDLREMMLNPEAFRLRLRRRFDSTLPTTGQAAFIFIEED